MGGERERKREKDRQRERERERERERKKERKKVPDAPLVVLECPFRGDLIPDASRNLDPHLPMLARVSSLVDALQVGGSYELVERLLERFVLTASR